MIVGIVDTEKLKREKTIFFFIVFVNGNKNKPIQTCFESDQSVEEKSEMSDRHLLNHFV